MERKWRTRHTHFVVSFQFYFQKHEIKVLFMKGGKLNWMSPEKVHAEQSKITHRRQTAKERGQDIKNKTKNKIFKNLFSKID